MKKLDQSLPHPHAINEGWSIHIYGSNRRLLCTLDSSHGWCIVAGFAVGLVMTVGYVCLNQQYITQKAPVSHQAASQPVQSPASAN